MTGRLTASGRLGARTAHLLRDGISALLGAGAPSWTVDVTDDYGQTKTVNVPPDPTTLRQIAEQTGGRFFEAPTEADLKAVYEEIGSQVSWEDDERELTAAFAAAGAVFLLIGASLSALWFGRIP